MLLKIAIGAKLQALLSSCYVARISHMHHKPASIILINIVNVLTLKTLYTKPVKLFVLNHCRSGETEAICYLLL